MQFYSFTSINSFTSRVDASSRELDLYGNVNASAPWTVLFRRENASAIVLQVKAFFYRLRNISIRSGIA